MRFLCYVCCILVCLCLCACSSTVSQDPSEWTPTIANCWVCAIYGTSFEIANDIVFSATAVMFPLARDILGIGLLFLLLFRVGAIMMFVPEQQMGQILKDTAFVFLKAMFVAIILYNGDDFLFLLKEYVIYPLGQFFMMMANAVMDCVPGSGQYFTGIAGITPDPKVMKGVIVNINGTIAPIDMNKSIFGDLGIQVQYTVSRIFSSLNAGIGLVLHMFAIGGFFGWILGIVAGWQLFSLMVMFPLAFVDGFIMLAFYVIFVPLTLALWVFPVTKGYFHNIIPKIISPFLQLLVGCIIVVLMITMIQVYSQMGLSNMLNSAEQVGNPAIVEDAVVGRPSILIMIILLISVKKMAGQVGEFAGLFSGDKGDDATLFGLIDGARRALKKAAVIVAEATAAVLSGGATAAASVAKRVAIEAAKRAAKEAAKAAARAAAEQVSRGSGGEGSDSSGGSGGGP